MKKSIRLMLLLFFVAVLAFSLWQLWEIFIGYQEGKNSYNDLEQCVSFGESVDPTETSEKDTTTSEEPEDMNTESIEEPDLSAWP